jgi:uracil-DNA glycosylase family protein
VVERRADVTPSRQMRRSVPDVVEPDSAEAFGTLDEAREAIDDCRRCPLYKMATQAVFGEGPERADVMFVGEQPGDQEDLAGRPFVGPAGKLFDAGMETAGLKRERAYVTNAVKHFKFVPRGKRRLHQRPNAGEVKACKFWLNLEREFVKPKLVVALGATAVQSLAGGGTTLRSVRGKITQLEDGSRMFATVHPSFLLRMPDREQAAVERERFVEDLREVKKLVGH